MNEIDRETAVQWAKDAEFHVGEISALCSHEQIQALITRAIEYGRRQAETIQQEPAGWIQFVDGVQTQNFFRDEIDLQTIDKLSKIMNKKRLICYEPVYRHPPKQFDLAELMETATKALKEIQDVMHEAYNNAYPVCCGQSKNGCCGCAVPEWSEQDQKTMDRFVKHENALRAALAKYEASK